MLFTKFAGWMLRAKPWVKPVMYGLIALALITLFVLLIMHSEARKTIARLLFELKTTKKIDGLQQQAAAALATAKAGQADAAVAELAAAAINTQIVQHKQDLQASMQDRGMTSDEISAHFNSIGL